MPLYPFNDGGTLGLHVGDHLPCDQEVFDTEYHGLGDSSFFNCEVLLLACLRFGELGDNGTCTACEYPPGGGVYSGL